MILIVAAIAALIAFLGLLWAIEKGRTNLLFGFLVALVTACIVLVLAATT